MADEGIGALIGYSCHLRAYRLSVTCFMTGISTFGLEVVAIPLYFDPAHSFATRPPTPSRRCSPPPHSSSTPPVSLDQDDGDHRIHNRYPKQPSMSFNLSTLADIGGGGVVSSSDIDATPIAPELIGEGVHTADSVNGHAPHRTSPSVDSQQPSSAYPNFANSNARGGDEDVSATWDTTQSYGVSDRQWDETAYTYDPTSTVNTVEAGIQPDPTGASPPKEDNPKPKKRPRVSKPRVPKAEREDQLELEQMEFENPDQDVKTGPVFIHPPPGTAQACVRCHRIKRKCDQARPRCAGCSKSDVPCVFELSPATSL